MEVVSAFNSNLKCPVMHVAYVSNVIFLLES